MTERAFSSKKQKTSAAEIRRQLAESTNFPGTLDSQNRQLDGGTMRKSSKSLLLDQCLSLNEIAAPVDVEEVLSSRQIKRLEIKLPNNKIQRISDYNEKDVSVRTVPRERVFLPNTLSAITNISAELESSVINSAQLTIDQMLTTNANRPNLFDNNANVDRNQFNNGKQLVSLLPDHLKSTNNKFRSTFELPSVLPDEFLSVKFNSLRLEPCIEPFFAFAYFFDLQTKTRLTENFHFDFNSREILGMIRAHIGIDEQPFKIREALLNAEHFGPNVFLIIRLEKVLQASDISEAIEPYVSKDKSKEKLTYAAREFCDRLGTFRMPVGWNFVELRSLLHAPQQKVSDAYKNEEVASLHKQADSASIISADRLSGSTNDTLYQNTVSASTVISQGDSSNGDGKGASSQTTTSAENEPLGFYQKLTTMPNHRHSISSMFKIESEKLSDHDIAKVLADYQKSGSSRLARLKSFPVELNLEMSIRKSDAINDYLSSELLPASDFIAEDTADKARELLTFPQKQTFRVHSFYRNLLFIYPRSVNFSSRSGNFRNITVRVELLNSAHVRQKVFFGKSCGSKMLSQVNTSIVYHNKTPQFVDEIKLELPVDLDDGHYLLFTFLHISCKIKQTDVVETPIGYTWIPLYMQPPPQGMTYISPTNNVPNIKWLDNHKELFDVSFVSVSTVHPEDHYLTEFFRCFHSLNDTSKSANIVEQELQVSIKNLTKASPEKLAAYLYLIFDKLIALISSPLSEELSVLCFDVLCQLVKLSTVLFDGKVDSNSRCALLSNYITSLPHPEQVSQGLQSGMRDSESLINLIRKYEQSTSVKPPTQSTESRDANKRLVHEEIVRLFAKASGSLKDQLCTYPWFFCELTTKAIVEYLTACNRFVLPRKLRLRDEFLENLNTIEASEPLETALMTLKLSFMRIISSHEHFVLLNLPFDFQVSTTPSLLANFKSSVSLSGISSVTSTNQPMTAFPSTIQPAPPSPSSSLSSKSSGTLDTDLNANYRAKHFLCGIILNDLAAALNSTNTLIHAKAIELLTSLLVTHELDDRLNDKNAWLKNRLICLYLPLISIVMDARSNLHDPHGRSASSTNTGSSQSSGRLLDPKVAGSIAGLDRLPIEHNVTGHLKMHLKQSGTLTQKQTKELLACFCWVLKNIDRPVLFNFLREFSIQRMQQFVDLIQLCVTIFEHKPLAESFLSDLDSRDTRRRHSNAAAPEDFGTLKTGPKISAGGNCSSTVRWRKNADMTISRHSTLATTTTQNIELLLERELATEITLVLLDSLVKVVQVVTLPELDHFLFILPNVFRSLVNAHVKMQPICKSLESIFVVQRAFVARFPELIFEQQNELCAELCLELLRYMSSRQSAVRAQAASSLYLLMRQSFEHSLNFSKLKVQITMALSTLVSSSTSFGLLNEDNIRHSLKAIISFMKHDTIIDKSLKDTSFNSQVTTMIFNLSTIIMDTCQMKNYCDDFEMLTDLMYRIAKGYQNNPDLRLTWLLNISQKHLAVQNYAEAAQCLLHACALSCEYMSLQKLNETIPNGASAFKSLSMNVDDECALEETIPDEEGICESTYFTIDGFLHLVDKTADLFEKSNQFELISKLYKVAQPILEKQQNYTRLARIHARVSSALQKIDVPVYYNENNAVPSLLATDKRSFGTYFRVGFYGHKFGDLNGSQFIYKEPFFTKLPEISHRLELFYASQLGRDIVEVVKDSNDLDLKQLDPNKCYLQITFVEPYFDLWEKRRRTTHLDMNYGLRRFVYQTPFTRDGKAHGSLETQYKRRTILTTKHCFPYLKTRIRVVEKEQTTLTPIEVALEDLQKKTKELCAATKMEPADAKMLQMLLQGCISTAVNQGPIEIARVFLSKIETDEHGKPIDPMQNKLRICFKDFSKKCSDALQKNETLISADQFDYQKEMRNNFKHFTQQLAQILAGPVYATNLEQQFQLNSRGDLPIHLHAFTSHVIGSNVGRISSV
ncbi:putative Dock-9 [Aphelenchoides bicaudatus]|nr:putative Dock-9 [Aphelenchoides bicaudatus]